jgi:4-azaleucine resistance transporter AzlC
MSRILTSALRYSIPVLLGYLTIGIAFGLMLVDAGYPWWLAPAMSVVMYAGAGQYIGVGLFAAGTGLWEAALIQLVVNARHVAYGLSLFRRISAAGPFKYYLIFSLTDETFALLSSMPELPEENRSRFMFYVALLDHLYWIAGSLIGAVVGALIPFNIEGIGFALTALFIVLMIEQILRIRKEKGPLPWTALFFISALSASAAALTLSSRISLLSAMVVSLVLVQILDQALGARRGRPC